MLKYKKHLFKVIATLQERVCNLPAISERKQKILALIIESYIATGEPVGSKTLQSAMGNSVSSATIRNEMSELEEMGYLTHLHTSSGRVPTKEGYEKYISEFASLVEKYKNVDKK